MPYLLGFHTIHFFESLKHAGQPWVGFVAGIWNLNKNCLSLLCSASATWCVSSTVAAASLQPSPVDARFSAVCLFSDEGFRQSLRVISLHYTNMDETNWLQVGDVLDNFLLLEGTCEDLNALHEPLFLDVVVDTINVPEVSTTTSEVQIESSPSPDVVADIKSLPFPCPKCPKTFQFRSRLQRHLTTHQVQTLLIKI